MKQQISLIKILRNNKGVTLFETSIAVFMTLVFSLVLLRSHMNVQTSVHTSSHHYEILHSIQSYIENERSKDYEDISSQTINNAILSDNGTNDTGDDLTGDINIVVTATGNDSKQIDVTATWSEKAANGWVNRSETISTRVANVT